MFLVCNLLHGISLFRFVKRYYLILLLRNVIIFENFRNLFWMNDPDFVPFDHQEYVNRVSGNLQWHFGSRKQNFLPYTQNSSFYKFNVQQSYWAQSVFQSRKFSENGIFQSQGCPKCGIYSPFRIHYLFWLHQTDKQKKGEKIKTTNKW